MPSQKLLGVGQNFDQCLVENYQELVKILTNAGRKLLVIGQNFDQHLGVKIFLGIL